MPQQSTELTLMVTGMDCAGCARTVENGVSKLEGVTSCSLNFTTERLVVSGNITNETVMQRVRDLGFGIAGSDDSVDVTGPKQASPTSFLQFMWRRWETRLALLAVLLILPGVLFEEILGLEYTVINLASFMALLIAGWPVARSAWNALRFSREININVLMTLAAIGAVFIGEYTEAGLVMVLFAIGEALEGYTASRARESIRTLMEVVPKTATLLQRDGQDIVEKSVSVDTLHINDVIAIKPGERIPMDGQVVAGLSAVNQAAITGESRLIEKETGDTVFAGTINGAGALEVEVTRLAQDNMISRVIQLVETAQEKKAPAQRFIDRFAQVYTPAVVLLAALVMIVPPLLFGQPFFNSDDGFGWLYRGLALLIVACPCALVISTPVSVISAISNAAAQGVLIKGGAYLESLSRVKAIAFDKTGTLTQGTPTVVNVRSVSCENNQAENAPQNQQGDCIPCNEVVALADAVERRSEHPFALAINEEAQRRGVKDQYATAEMVQTLIGQGVQGHIADQKVFIGSHTYFDKAVAHPQQHCQAAQADAAEGYTTMMVEQDDIYLGTIVVTDTVRQSSRTAISNLKQLGLKAVVMLTGDNKPVAQKIAQQTGVTEVKANLLPADKLTAIEDLQEEYGVVAMVGDGINDAPALARADVGIAIGAASGGTAQAMESADISLMSDDLTQLSFAFHLSQKTQHTIWTNVALSLVIKLLFVILVVFGMGTMWLAVLADMGTSLLVTLNGMRLLRWRETVS
ncbi:MAG: heavy metal translocating P-type ATPase [Chloroflexota bacterium]